MRLGRQNGLRWLTMLTCNTLRDVNFQTYLNQNKLPSIIGPDMHLLLSAETIMSGNNLTGEYYAQNLKNGQFFPTAWFKALRDTIAKNTTKPDTNRVARVIGHSACFNDKLNDWVDPDTNFSFLSN